ncbi:MAG: carbamoyl phosphate synthase large subunit, partial [Acidithiobacillus sp.]|nr:carbamoyl phosphate synthase large subunit [Acidithiobacillus sp.]
GPEMKSTGEVMGIGASFGEAFLKAQIGAGEHFPRSGTVFLSVRDADKKGLIPAARTLSELGFKLIATKGTAAFLHGDGLEVTAVNKVTEGRPHIVDAIKNGKVQIIINTVDERQSVRDSFSIRRAALQMGLTYYTTLAGAIAGAAAIHALMTEEHSVLRLQDLNQTNTSTR